jgi:hypothetical protein
MVFDFKIHCGRAPSVCAPGKSHATPAASRLELSRPHRHPIRAAIMPALSARTWSSVCLRSRCPRGPPPPLGPSVQPCGTSRVAVAISSTQDRNPPNRIFWSGPSIATEPSSNWYTTRYRTSKYLITIRIWYTCVKVRSLYAPTKKNLFGGLRSRVLDMPAIVFLEPGWHRPGLLCEPVLLLTVQ